MNDLLLPALQLPHLGLQFPLDLLQLRLAPLKHLLLFLFLCAPFLLELLHELDFLLFQVVLELRFFGFLPSLQFPNDLILQTIQILQQLPLRDSCLPGLAHLCLSPD